MSADTPRDPTLDALLELVAEVAVYGIRVMLPGRVLSYDADTHRCSVQLLIKDGDVGEDGVRRAISIAPLHDVPVGFPGGGRIRIRWPLTVGDEVMVHFASSSIARYKQVGGEVDPQDDRRHDLSDGVVWPIYNIADPQDAEALIEFTDDDKVRIGGDDPLVRRSELLNHTHGSFGAPPAEIVPDGGGTPFPGTPKLRG